MRIVVDSSIIIPLFLSDEDETLSEALLREKKNGHELISLDLSLLEVSNTLLQAVRRRRIKLDEAVRAIHRFRKLPISVLETAPTIEMENILRMAESRHLSFYDAAYLAAATRLGGQLATLDSKLQKAAEASGIEVYGAPG